MARIASSYDEVLASALCCVNQYIQGLSESSYMRSWVNIRLFIDSFVAGLYHPVAMQLAKLHGTVGHGSVKHDVTCALLPIAITRACDGECSNETPGNDPIASVILAMRDWGLNVTVLRPKVLAALVNAASAAFTGDVCECRSALVLACAGWVFWKGNYTVDVLSDPNGIHVERLRLDPGPHFRELLRSDMSLPCMCH